MRSLLIGLLCLVGFGCHDAGDAEAAKRPLDHAITFTTKKVSEYQDGTAFVTVLEIQKHYEGISVAESWLVVIRAGEGIAIVKE